MAIALHDEQHIDILTSLFVFCSAASLCKLAQTCRSFRSLFLDKGEETAIRRLELFSTGRERFCQMLKEFGGLSVASTGIVLSTIFHIDREMLVDAQKSVIEDLMKRSSLVVNKSWEKIIQVQMNTEGMNLNRRNWEKGLFPFILHDIHVHITRYTRTYYTIYTYILHDIHALPLLPKASDALATVCGNRAEGQNRSEL